MLVCDRPVAAAIERIDQWVASFGVVCNVAWTIASTSAGVIIFLRPGRVASFSTPASPASR